MRKDGRPTLVATLGEAIVGCLTLSMMEVLHRPRPVGRISMLVVSEEQRGAGIGTDLVAAHFEIADQVESVVYGHSHLGLVIRDW